MVKTVPIFGIVLLRNGALGCGIVNPCTVGKKDIQPAIIVIVKQGDARSHSFEKIFLAGRGSLVTEMNSELLSGVEKGARSRGGLGRRPGHEQSAKEQQRSAECSADSLLRASHANPRVRFPCAYPSLTIIAWHYLKLAPQKAGPPKQQRPWLKVGEGLNIQI